MTTTSSPTTEIAPASAPGDLTRRWADAFNAGDLPALMSMYEPDAVLVPGPGADPVRGHAAIEASLQWFLGLGGTLRFTTRFWLVEGDLALGSVAFVMDDGRDQNGDPVDLRGSTSELIRRQPDGSWKYVVDHPFGGSA
ncbi:YybH family protein [Jatrophihabitans sp. YIM 134969]